MENPIQTEEELVKRIQHRHEDEKPLDSKSVDKDPEDFWLLEAAKRFYGEKYKTKAWGFALKSAGIDLAEIRFAPRTDEKFYNETQLAKPGKNPKKAERKLLEKLQRDKEFCAEYCANLHQTIIHHHELNVSNRIVPCLEYLISNLDSLNPQKRGVLVEGKYLARTTASKSGKNTYHNICVAGKKYPLDIPPKLNSQSIDAIVDINPNEDQGNIFVTTQFAEVYGGKQKRRSAIKLENNFVPYENLTTLLFNNCSGVEIRYIGKSRRIKLPDGKSRKVDRKTQGNYAIFIFNRGEYQLFNLFGEKIDNCNSKGMIQQEKCQIKINRLEKDSADFDKEEFIEEARQYLINQWKENRAEWGRDGRCMVIEGESYVHVQRSGNIFFGHLTNSNEREQIHVGKTSKGKDVKAVFRGPVVFFNDQEKIINAYSPNHPVGFECRRVEAPKTEYLRIKDISNLRVDISFESAKNRVVLKKNKIAAAAGIDLEGRACALIGHVRKRFSEKDIELLMLTDEGNVISKRIVPEGIKKEQIEDNAKDSWPATKAIDYLMLSPNEKIEWRIKNNISIKEWFEQFKPVHLTGEYIETTEVSKMFNLFGIHRTAKKGHFKNIIRRGTQRYVCVDDINKLLEKRAKLIPVSEFYLKLNGFYLEQCSFDDKFRDFYQQFLDKRERVVSITDAARIASSLNQRRRMFNWPTPEDLNRESGMQLPPHAVTLRYGEMHEKGDLELVKTWQKFRIPPEEYRRILKLEKERAGVLNKGLTTGDIARRLNLHISTVYDKIIEYEKQGIVKPMRGSKTSAYSDRIVLTEEQANLIFRK